MMIASVFVQCTFSSLQLSHEQLKFLFFFVKNTFFQGRRRVQCNVTLVWFPALPLISRCDNLPCQPSIPISRTVRNRLGFFTAFRAGQDLLPHCYSFCKKIRSRDRPVAVSRVINKNI